MPKNKKSYMSSKNILDEGILDSIIKAITTGKGPQLTKMAGKNKKMKKAKIDKDIENLNKTLDSIDDKIEKLFGIESKKTHLTFSDLIKEK